MRKISPETFRLLAQAPISHGAFRLWHLLFTGYSNQYLKAWPSIRRLLKELRCSKAAYYRWRSELELSGFLELDTESHRSMTYVLIDKGDSHERPQVSHERPQLNGVVSPEDQHVVLSRDKVVSPEGNELTLRTNSTLTNNVASPPSSEIDGDRLESYLSALRESANKRD